VRGEGLLAGDAPLVVMLSGGRDSVCLLDLAVEIHGVRALLALHVNYGLRPEADEDERHCRELCARLGVELEVVRARRPEGAGNLQAWARELRYREAERLAGEFDVRKIDPAARAHTRVRARGGVAEERPIPSTADARIEAAGEAALTAEDEARIATGHTASDQVETILYRFAASPGRRALLGMASREGRVVRPLLGVTREQTAAYCRARALRWREDASNDDERFARARVRSGVVPALRAVHPAAEENVLRTAKLLRAEAEALEALIDAELRDASSIAIERLRSLPPALARLIVIRLAENAAGTFVPQAGGRVAEMLALAERGGRAELHVGGLVAAVIEGGRLSMVRLPPRD
jgi:tRNA(Ile)-lysidine synthase